MGIYGTRDGKFTVKKLVVNDKMPVNFTIANTVANSTTAILEDWDVSAGAVQKTNTGFTEQPPYPMVLSVCASTAGTAGGGDNIVFVGYNQFGNKVTDTVHVAATAATVTYTSNAYSWLTSVTADDALHKSDAVHIGYKNSIGLPHPIAASGDVISYQYASANGTTVAYTVDTDYHTITPTTVAVDKSLRVLYKTKLQV